MKELNYPKNKRIKISYFNPRNRCFEYQNIEKIEIYDLVLIPHFAFKEGNKLLIELLLSGSGNEEKNL